MSGDPTVILIPGWAHGSDAMEPLAPKLADFGTVCSLSLHELYMEAKETALSAEAGAASRQSAYALALEARIRRSRGAVCLVGWSMGGLVALEAALEVQERISALILLATAPRFCAGEGYDAGAPQAVVRAMRQGLRRNPQAVLEEFFCRAYAPRAVHREVPALKARAALCMGAEALGHGLDYLRHIDLRDAIGSICLPCLVAHGKEDQIVPWQAARLLTFCLPASKTVTRFIPNAGHMLFDEDPEDLAHSIRAFLEDNS